MRTVRLLIVDDNPSILRNLEILLNETYEVVLARDGVVGYTKLVKYLPDIVILDIMMPKMSGYQMYDLLRKNPQVKDTPVIFLSAKGTPLEKEYGIKKGAVAYIVKPYENKDLIEAIENLIKEKPPVPKHRPHYDEVVIERSKEKDILWA